MILPGILFTAARRSTRSSRPWVTGDQREHHLLDRPRNAPTRTALGVMAITFYVMLWIAGGNDIIATHFDLSINDDHLVRCGSLLFVLPPIVFVITKRICLGLQRRDRDKLLHGYETGTIMRLPHGEFIEVHAPVVAARSAPCCCPAERRPAAASCETEPDANGVDPQGQPVATDTRQRLSRRVLRRAASTKPHARGARARRRTTRRASSDEGYRRASAEQRDARPQPQSLAESAALNRSQRPVALADRRCPASPGWSQDTFQSV